LAHGLKGNIMIDLSQGLIPVVKELEDKINTLQSKVEQLEAQLADIAAQLRALQGAV
jgi:chaperonin cofactor prefoldin